jgi:hypothetical protein
VQQLSVPSFYPYFSLSWLGPWSPACREKKYDGLRLQLPAGPASVAAVVAVAEAVADAEAVVVAEVVLVDEAVVVVEELVLDEEVVLDEAVVAVATLPDPLATATAVPAALLAEAIAMAVGVHKHCRQAQSFITSNSCCIPSELICLLGAHLVSQPGTAVGRRQSHYSHGCGSPRLQ